MMLKKHLTFGNKDAKTESDPFLLFALPDQITSLKLICKYKCKKDSMAHVTPPSGPH